MALEGLLKGGLHTRASNFRGWGAENERRGGEKRTLPGDREGPGGSASPLPWATLESPRVQVLHLLGNQYAPGGSLSDLPENTKGEGQLWPGHNTDPEPFWNSRWEKTLRTLVPFDFKGKLEKGNSKSISPKKVRFPLDKDRASQVSACAGTETPEAFVTHTKRSFGPF